MAVNNPKSYNNSWIGYIIALLAGAAALLMFAFINGYPTTNPDTFSYLTSGFTLVAPDDRPLMYGILIRIFSLDGITLWGMIVVQALLISWLTIQTFKIIFGSQKHLLYSFISICILCITTSVSWITSELIPDVFTPVSILSLLLILLGPEKRSTRVTAFIIFFFAIATHISHVLIFCALLSLLFICHTLFFVKEQRQRVRIAIAIMFVLCIGNIPLMQKATSTSGHAFLMASLLEKGVLKPYLDDKCADRHYTICKYKDSMSTNPNTFLWEDESPMKNEGGWDGTREEYNMIIKDIFTHYPYNIKFVYMSVQFAFEQLGSFRIGDGTFIFDEGSQVYRAVKNYAPGEAGVFLRSRQNTGRLYDYLFTPSLIIKIIVLISVIGLAFLMTYKQLRQHKQIQLLLFIVIAAILINAIDCAAFAQVNGRYGCRVMWLLPFCFIVMSIMRFKTNSAKNLE